MPIQRFNVKRTRCWMKETFGHPLLWRRESFRLLGSLQDDGGGYERVLVWSTSNASFRRLAFGQNVNETVHA